MLQVSRSGVGTQMAWCPLRFSFHKSAGLVNGVLAQAGTFWLTSWGTSSAWNIPLMAWSSQPCRPILAHHVFQGKITPGQLVTLLQTRLQLAVHKVPTFFHNPLRSTSKNAPLLLTRVNFAQSSLGGMATCLIWWATTRWVADASSLPCKSQECNASLSKTWARQSFQTWAPVLWQWRLL